MVIKRFFKIDIQNLIFLLVYFAAPRVFAFAFGIVKKFLNAYTLSKIQIYKSDQKKWLPKILEKVDISQVPLYYGGTMTGENGDPKCLNKVRLIKL